MKKSLSFLFILFTTVLFAQGPQADAFKGTATGTNSYSVTINAITSATIYDKQTIWFRTPNTNTGASTLKINGAGSISYSAIEITNNGNSLIAGDLVANQYYEVVYSSALLKLQLQKTSAASPAWLLPGNAGTIAGTNFIGTTDNIDFVTKTNGIERLRILGSNGNVGIGLNNPTSLLHVKKTISGTAVVSDVVMENHELNINSSANTANNLIIQQNILTFSGASDYTSSSIIPLLAQTIHAGTGMLAVTAAAVGITDITSSGTVNGGIGLAGLVHLSGSGLYNQAIGVFGQLSNQGSGTMNNATTFYAAPPEYNNGTIGALYGIFIGDHSGFGAGSTINLYSQGINAPNVFDGQVGIGVVPTIHKFDVFGDIHGADGVYDFLIDNTNNIYSSGSVTSESDVNANLWTDGIASWEADASVNTWSDGVVSSFNADANGFFYQSGPAAFEGDAFAHLWVDGILASWEGDANGHNWSDGVAAWEGDALGNNWSNGLGVLFHGDAGGLYWSNGVSTNGEFTVDEFNHIWTNNQGAIFEGDINAFKWSDGADSIVVQSGNLFYRSANFDTLRVSQNSFQFIGSGGGGFIDNATGMGIGTTNPIAPLDVHGSGTGNVLMGQFGGSSAYGALSLNGSLATDQQNFASSAGDKNLYINRPTGNNIYFQEGGGISSGFKTGGNFFVGQDLSVPVRLFVSDAFVGVLAVNALHNDAVATNNNTSQLLFSNNRTTTGRTNVAGVGGIITDITDGAYKGALAFYTTDNTTIPTERMRITSTGALAINGASNYGTSGQVLTSNGNSYPTWQAAGKDPIAYFTPVTTNTITLTNNAYNIVDPAGTIALLTINLPSSPSDGDFVEIKFTQIITAITFTNGTLGGAETLTAAAVNDYRKYVYRAASSKWY